MTIQPTPDTQAQLRWNEDGLPISTRFDDVYFSRDNGLAETRHVFLQHNDLLDRWRNLSGNHSRFVIGETGFGTGLNFLAAWQLWRQTVTSEAHLHFVSVERYPLNKADLRQALKLWPELAPLSSALIEAYPSHTGSGFHCLSFDGGQVQLTLIIDEAAAGLEQMLASDHPLHQSAGTKVDAWFLDGFAPAKNPDMWRQQLFDVIARLSTRGTSLATFTAAGLVKRGLQQVGFSIEKVPGFGHKREMIRALMPEMPTEPNRAEFPTGAFNASHNAPWYLPRKVPEDRSGPGLRTAIVIGGGLAGCHTARALAEEGWRVRLIERHPSLASEGSGNPQGILYAKLSPKQEALSQFNLSALLFAQRFYQPLWQSLSGDFGAQCGVLQLAHTEKEAALHNSLVDNYIRSPEFVQFVDAATASSIAGISLAQPALYFPAAGWIHPPGLCQHLVNHRNIQVETGVAVDKLEPDTPGWSLWDSQQRLIAQAPAVVIATANQARTFTQTRHLPLRPIRGQVSILPATDESHALKTVLCGEGYMAPAHKGQHCLGATFNLKENTTDLRPEDHRHNLDNLKTYIPDLYRRFPAPSDYNLAGRVAFRCSSRDYLPLVGPAPKLEGFVEDYQLLRKNAKASIPVAGDYWPGLYLNVGHGSRGLAYTPLCAKLLASQITHAPPPLGRQLATALNPARFIIRELIRNQR